MASDLHSRIDTMFRRDRFMALCLLVLLWFTIAFVYFATDRFVTDSYVRAALVGGAVVVVFFNTASIVAMIRHYMHDKFHIYSLDIQHLDRHRERATQAQREAKKGDAVTART